VNALLVLAFLAPAAPPPKETAADVFRRVWGEPVDPLKDCTIEPDGTRLRLKMPGSPHPFTPAGEKPSLAPRVRRELTGDFDARVKVVSVTPPGEDSGGTLMSSGGLYLGTDDSTYITISQYSTWGRNGPGANIQYLSNQRAPDAPSTGEQKDRPAAAEGKPSYVRFVRAGQTVTAYTSHDGEKWDVHCTRSYAWPDKVYLGVFASHGTNKPVEALFDDFTVTTPKDKSK
jgi:hypothetical protein